MNKKFSLTIVLKILPLEYVWLDGIEWNEMGKGMRMDEKYI